MHPVPKPPKRVKARKRMQTYNAKRQGRMYADRRDDAYLEWQRQFPCALCMAFGETQTHPTEAEHWVKKSAGGYDRGDTFPTCQRHREFRHGSPRLFEAACKEAGVNPRKLCDWFKGKYEAEMYPCP